LELLPDDWDDGFLQSSPIHATTTSTSTSAAKTRKTKQRNKKHIRINTSRNTTYHIPEQTNESPLTTTTRPRTSQLKSKSKSKPTPTPISQHYITTPTITFAEWERLSSADRSKLKYTFCIQCEKPMDEIYLYDHHQIHVQQHNQSKTTTTTITTTSPSTPPSPSTSTSTSAIPLPTRSSTRI
jgi:hypothetical protein